MTSDSDDDSAFMAFNISMTTRIDRDIVEAVREVVEVAAKMEQSVEA